MIENASAVVNQPLPVVEAVVRDVSSWVALFGEVEDVSRLARDRYLVQLRRGRRVYPALLRVNRQAVDHRVNWRTLSGPAWSGELRLVALTGRRTAVHLAFDRTPRGLRLRSGSPDGARDGSPLRSPDRSPRWWRVRWRGIMPAFGRVAIRRPPVGGQAKLDVRRLQERVDALPRPVRPRRMGPLPGTRPVEDILIIDGLRRRPETSQTEVSGQNP